MSILLRSNIGKNRKKNTFEEGCINDIMNFNLEGKKEENKCNSEAMRIEA